MTIAPEDLRGLEAMETLVGGAPVEEAEAAAVDVGGGGGGGGEGGGGGDTDDASAVATASTVALATLLAAAGTSWMVGGVFRNALVARALCLLGTVIGVALIRLSYRLARPALAQYAVLPVAALAGAIAVAPAATGGTANLPGLVADALRAGGLRQPPVPFDPGWRFILVVLFALLSAGALTNAVRKGMPRLGVIAPAAVTLGAAILQPSGGELVSSTPAVLVTIGAFAVAYGADLSAGGSMGARYEARRLARGAVLLVALVGVMVGLARFGFLFPDTDKDKILPPQKPPAAPLEKDRELFRVQAPRPGPWRVGTLDVYDGTAWLLPPYDPDAVKPFENRSAENTYTAEFDLVDVKGRSLPVPSGLVAVHSDQRPEYDPRTEVPRLAARIPRHFKYRVEAANPPTGKELNASPAPDPGLVEEFTDMPAAPPEVLSLLNEAPTSPFDRLQFVRDRLYASVVVAGSGQPIDISAARVGELLQPDAEGSPYEISAAEAMLARWAGVPARIGFGFHGGEPMSDGSVSFRPKHGAVWLEAYFEGHGWVPLVGTPPRAKSSLTADQKNADPRIKPSDDISVPLYLPARRLTFTLLYEVVRYWVLAALPLLALAAGTALGAPVAAKLARSVRRRRWGEARGPVGEVLAAYSEFRDRCHDLNLSDVRWTPLEFADAFVEDAEHEELAWLVTRVLWADLRRDVRHDDAAACRALCKSVYGRMSAEQNAVNRLLGAVSRASLRDPFSDQVPNVWPRRSPMSFVRSARRRVARLARRLRLRRPVRLAGAAPIVLAVVMASTLSGCVKQGGLTGASTPVRLPELFTGGELLGYEVRIEDAAAEKYRQSGKRLLVDDGRVFTFMEGDVTQGVLQVALFKPDVDSQDEAIQRDVEKSIASSFRTYRFGTVRLRVHEGSDQRIFLWFPPDSNTMEVFVMRKQFADGLRLVRAAVAAQRGLDPERYAGTTRLPVDAPAARPSGGPQS